MEGRRRVRRHVRYTRLTIAAGYTRAFLPVCEISFCRGLCRRTPTGRARAYVCFGYLAARISERASEPPLAPSPRVKRRVYRAHKQARRIRSIRIRDARSERASALAASSRHRRGEGEGGQVASGNWASWRSGGVFRVADNDDRSGSIKMCEEAGGREEGSSSRSRADRHADYARRYHRDNGGMGRGRGEGDVTRLLRSTRERGSWRSREANSGLGRVRPTDNGDVTRLPSARSACSPVMKRLL